MERAKKINNGEMAGVIRTRDGQHARIIATDIVDPKSIAAAITNMDGNEDVELYFADGHYYNDSDCADYDLVIELPTEYKDYVNFRPTKYQPCLARDKNGWQVVVCMGYEQGRTKLLPAWICGAARIATDAFETVPLTALTEPLIGKKITYEDYVRQQTNEETD